MPERRIQRTPSEGERLMREALVAADPHMTEFLARHEALLERVTVLERILEGRNQAAILRAMEALEKRDRAQVELHAPGATFKIPVSRLKEYQAIVETVLRALDA